jgi:O-antigen/teichoic acid export membrane protein
MKVIWGIQGLFGAAMRVFLHLADQDGETVGRTYTRVISLIVVPALIMHTVGAILLSWVAHRWVDINASQLMLFYAIATLSNLGMIFVTPLYISLISRGDLAFILRSQITLALTNIVASTLLIPLMGLKGAAFGLFTACLYNVIAVYKRHDFLFGAPVGLLSSIRSLCWRMSLMAGLFLLAILLGRGEAANELGMIAILTIIAVSLVRDPLIAELARRAGFRRQ